MNNTEWVVATAVGMDRPGLVNELTGWLFRHGGNLEDSRMALLGGEFAVLLLVRFDKPTLAELRNEIEAMEKQTGLALQLRLTAPRGKRDVAIPFDIQLVGQDHQGIVHRVAELLAGMGVNVVALETRAGNAPITGVPLFSMHLRAEVPANVSVASFRNRLQVLAEELNVDIDIHPVNADR
jgi:glycine cleavage system transcriptional repressor